MEKPNLQFADVAECGGAGRRGRGGALLALRAQRQEAVHVHLLRRLGVGRRAAVEAVALQVHDHDPVQEHQRKSTPNSSELILFSSTNDSHPTPANLGWGQGGRPRSQRTKDSPALKSFLGPGGFNLNFSDVTEFSCAHVCIWSDGTWAAW